MIANGLTLPKFDLLNQCSQSVRELTESLRKLGITLFSHTRIYKDHSFIDITDRADMLDYFYYQTDVHKYYLPDVNPWSFEQNFFLCNSLPNNPSIEGLRNHLNIDNIIVLFQRYETHCEVWHFGSESNNPGILNFYLNNLDVLKAFALSFKDKGSDLIEKCELNKMERFINPDIELPLILGNKTINKKEFFEAIKFSGLNLSYNKKNIRLSDRELHVLKWCLLGKTASEISMILSISSRTVEQHLLNIKTKMGCNRLADILRVLVNLDLVDVILNLSLD